MTCSKMASSKIDQQNSGWLVAARFPLVVLVNIWTSNINLSHASAHFFRAWVVNNFNLDFQTNNLAFHIQIFLSWQVQMSYAFTHSVASFDVM